MPEDFLQFLATFLKMMRWLLNCSQLASFFLSHVIFFSIVLFSIVLSTSRISSISAFALSRSCCSKDCVRCIETFLQICGLLLSCRPSWVCLFKFHLEELHLIIVWCLSSLICLFNFEHSLFKTVSQLGWLYQIILHFSHGVIMSDHEWSWKLSATFSRCCTLRAFCSCTHHRQCWSNG